MAVLRLMRVTVRLLLATVWTVGLVAARVAVIPVRLVSPRLETRCRRAVVRLWGRGACAIIGMRVTIQGTPPTPPFFLVSNHLTHVDVCLMAGALGGTFVAKSEVRSWPVLGIVARCTDIIFIVREKRSDTVRVNDRIGQALERGLGIVMFAESTTSRGSEIQPFKTALFESAVRNACPVHYATIYYATDDGLPPPSEWVCWWDGREASFGAHLLRMLSKPGFRAEVTFGEAPISADDRKTLAKRVWEAATAQFTPIE